MRNVSINHQMLSLLAVALVVITDEMARIADSGQSLEQWLDRLLFNLLSSLSRNPCGSDLWLGSAMAISKFRIVFFLLASILLCSTVKCEEEEASAVIVLDNSNFTEVVETHDFIVVEFYAPW